MCKAMCRSWLCTFSKEKKVVKSVNRFAFSAMAVEILTILPALGVGFMGAIFAGS